MSEKKEHAPPSVATGIASDQLYVEITGLEAEPLFIFADPLEAEPPPVEGAPGVLYFGPGVHTRSPAESSTPIADGTVVYLAGGAYVEGRLLFERGADFTLRGRGVLSGLLESGDEPLIEALGGDASSARRVEGIVLTDGPFYCLRSFGRTAAQNIKLMGWHVGTDGLTVGPDSTVDDVFVKVNDDGVKLYYSGISVTNVTAWMQPTGSVFQLSWGTPREVQGVRVADVDVIGCDLDGTVTAPVFR